MSRIIEQTSTLVRVSCMTRIVSTSLADFLKDGKYVVANSFHGELDALIPRCPSGHYGIEVLFFKHNSRMSNDALYKNYNELGLVPDPIAHARVLKDLPDLIRGPSITQWTYRAEDGYFSPFMSLEFQAETLTAAIGHAERGYLWNQEIWFCGARPKPIPNKKL